MASILVLHDSGDQELARIARVVAEGAVTGGAAATAIDAASASHLRRLGAQGIVVVTSAAHRIPIIANGRGSPLGASLMRIGLGRTLVSGLTELGTGNLSARGRLDQLAQAAAALGGQWVSLPLTLDQATGFVDPRDALIANQLRRLGERFAELTLTVAAGQGALEQQSKSSETAGIGAVQGSA